MLPKNLKKALSYILVFTIVLSYLSPINILNANTKTNNISARLRIEQIDKRDFNKILTFEEGLSLLDLLEQNTRVEKNQSNYGTFVTKINDYPSASDIYWMFRVNNQEPQKADGSGHSMDSYIIKPGDNIVVYAIQNTSYSYFENDSYSVEVGQTVSMNLKSIVYDSSTWTPHTQTVTGASITINDQATGIKTDKDGLADIKVDSPGTYEISVENTSLQDLKITRPFALVEVAQSQTNNGGMTDQEALEKLVEHFSQYGSRGTALDFDYENFSNAKDFILSEAKKIVPNKDIALTADFSILKGSEGTAPLDDVTMDSDGNISRIYSKNEYTYPGLLGANFTINGIDSEKISLLYLKVPAKEASPQEMVDYEASAISPDIFLGNNKSLDYITQKLEKKSGWPRELHTKGLRFEDKISVVMEARHISGPNSFQVTSKNKTTVTRPNVDEDPSKYYLDIVISYVEDSSIKKTVTYEITIPPLLKKEAVFNIKPSNANLTIMDNYYKEKLADKYIVIDADGIKRKVSLHLSHNDGFISYPYEVTADGYISHKGSLSIDDSENPVIDIDLIKSSEDDTKLKNIVISDPQSQSAIKVPMETFDKNKLTYNITLGHVDYVKIIPTCIVDSAEIETSYIDFRGKSRTYRYPSNKIITSYFLDQGQEKDTTTITLKVLPPDGSNQAAHTYTINVKREGEPHAITSFGLKNKSSLGGEKNNRVEDEMILTPTVSSGGIEDQYNYLVNYFIDKISLNPTYYDQDSLVKLIITSKGQDKEYDLDDEIILDLDEGPNNFLIKVIKSDQSCDIYKLVIRRKEKLIVENITYKNASSIGEHKPESWIIIFNYRGKDKSVTFSIDTIKDATISIDGFSDVYKPGQEITVDLEGRDTFYLNLTRTYVRNGVNYTDNQKYLMSAYPLDEISPVELVHFIPAASQFANTGFTDSPERLLAGDTLISLGGFGGKIIVRYDTPVENSPNNPYGIDFRLNGNAFPGSSEPGAVMVSKDGVNFYELAGSEYYNHNTQRNISVTYKNPDTSYQKSLDVPYETSLGEKGLIKTNSSHKQAYYPKKSFFDKYNQGIYKNTEYTDESLTVTGTRIKTLTPKFGYVDLYDGGNSQTIANPYRARPSDNPTGDAFDISWAVDSNGMPVHLDEINYIMVYTAVLEDMGAFGEASTEVSNIKLATSEDQPVGKTPDAESIIINDTKLDLKTNQYIYDLTIEDNSTVDVIVNSNNSDNIYIDNQYTQSGNKIRINNPEIIRIILQNGKKEPTIYYIKIKAINTSANLELESINIIPGDYKISNPTDNSIEFKIDHNINKVNLSALPVDKDNQILVEGQTIFANGLSQPLTIDLTNKITEVLLKVVNKTNIEEKIYTLKIIKKDKPNNEDPSEPSQNISVSFRLVGDTGEWLANKSYTIPKDSSVKYLTDMILLNEGFEFKTSGGTYISSINGLAEFDRGPNSGWMYKVNGVSPNFGYKEYTLKDGDQVLWFYTLDYTKEDSSKDYTSSNTTSIGSPSATTTTNNKKEENTIKLTSYKKGDSQVSTLVEKDLDAVLDKAKKNSMLNLDAKDKDNLYKKSELNIKKELVKKIIGKGVDVNYNSNLANISLSSDLLQTSKGDLDIKVQKSDDFNLSLSYIDNKVPKDILPKKIKIDFYFPNEDLLNTNQLEVYLIDKNGKSSIVKDAIFDYDKMSLSFSTNQLGNFQIIHNKEADIKKFNDVEESSKSKKYIDDMYNRGLMIGKSKEFFAPKDYITRAEVITILSRMETIDTDIYMNQFKDVPSDTYYTSAINWAFDSQIIFGIDGDNFAPDAKIVKEDLVTIIDRYLSYKNIPIKNAEEYNFADSDLISSYAKRPIAELKKANIIEADTKNKFNPSSNITREEFAKLISSTIFFINKNK